MINYSLSLIKYTSSCKCKLICNALGMTYAKKINTPTFFVIHSPIFEWVLYVPKQRTALYGARIFFFF